jgi:1-aminocyclopropane-1-carboxylate deaminase
MLLPPTDWLPQAPLEPLQLDWLCAAGIEVAILRLDQIDPLISGNKWFKLIEHLNAADRAGAEGIISLGGAHSNHLHALAAAGKRVGFKTVGLLRGHPQETATVKDLQAFGMHLHWLGYAGYRARHEADFWLPWREQYPMLHAVPEGGGRVARGARMRDVEDTGQRAIDRVGLERLPRLVAGLRHRDDARGIGAGRGG